VIYEHRSYSLLPGKKAEFIQEFGAKITPLFDKYGVKLVGAWETDVGESNEFIYILAFGDFAQRDEFWKKLRQDEVYLEYSRQGPRTANVTNKIIRPTKYSPLQ